MTERPEAQSPEAQSRGRQLRQGTLISRRDYLRMLVIASGGLLAGTAGLVYGVFRKQGKRGAQAQRIAATVSAGDLVNFSYPGKDDPAIALGLEGGEMVAFSSACTHLSCPVLWRKDEGTLICPCHNGVFDQRTGEVVAGPPPRPLPKILLEERPDGVYAIGT
ncbi:MAG: ubiquinol-cytochrome c reductase iron-sulfur subunit [Actinomycetota bacterium]